MFGKFLVSNRQNVFILTPTLPKAELASLLALCVHRPTNWRDEATRQPNLHPQWQKINWRCCDVKQLVTVCGSGSMQQQGLFCVSPGSVTASRTSWQINEADGGIKRTPDYGCFCCFWWLAHLWTQSAKSHDRVVQLRKNKLFVALSVTRETKLGRHKCAWTTLKWLLNTETTHLNTSIEVEAFFHFFFFLREKKRLHAMKVRLRISWCLY